MSYSAANHQVFSARLQNLALSFQGHVEEGLRLEAIYVNEGASGAHAEFVDNAIASKAEMQAFIGVIRDLADFFDGTEALSAVERQVKITPFIQVS